MLPQPKRVTLRWDAQQRIIPAHFPPISLFESIVDPADLEIAFAIESLTNDRLRDEVGEIALVVPEDRVSGPGSSVVMAAFTHSGNPSRFTAGDYGVYYAARSLETAIAETRYHRERFMAYTQEPDCEITMRVFRGKVLKPLHDVRLAGYQTLHDPNNYAPAQDFASKLRAQKSWGLVYRSVRDPGGQCIAALRPPALSIPTPGAHLRYVWRQSIQQITDILEVSHV